MRTEEPTPEYYHRTISADFKAPYIEKRVTGRAAANPQVTLLFHIPPVCHDDLPALYVLGRVMSARTGKIDMDLVEKEMWGYIEDAKVTPVNAQLLQRTKNSVEAQSLQSLAGTNVASSLASMAVAYRWQHLEDQFNARMAVTPDDLMRVAKKYFTRDNCVTGMLERER